MMERNGEHEGDASNAQHTAAISPLTAAAAALTEGQPLLLGVLKMLEPYAKNASIELSNNQKVSIEERDKSWTVLDANENETACKHLGPLGSPGSCEKSAQSPEGLRLIKEGEQTRQLVLDLFIETVKALNVEEKAKLLSVLGEEEFSVYAEQNDDLEKLQSIQYKFTRRVNDLKAKHHHKSPKRPVLEQRKVGDYLYKRQAGPKGGIYWYLQFTKEKKRQHVYLGKDTPSFQPAADLAIRQK